MLCNCGSKRSYCEYGVEICEVCGEKQAAKSQLVDLPYGVNVFIPDIRPFGYPTRQAQGYKGYGIIQKY